MNYTNRDLKMKEIAIKPEQTYAIKNMISSLLERDKRTFDTLMYGKASEPEPMIIRLR